MRFEAILVLDAGDGRREDRQDAEDAEDAEEGRTTGMASGSGNNERADCEKEGYPPLNNARRESHK